MIAAITILIAISGAALLLVLFIRIRDAGKELRLDQHRSKEMGFADLLVYAAVVEDGVIVGKNGIRGGEKIVQGDNFDVLSPEATGVFVAGFVDGAMNAVGGPAAKTVISAALRDSARTAALEAGNVAFTSSGRKILTRATEGVIGNSPGAMVRTAADDGTWKEGFAKGFGTVLQSGLEAGALGAAIHLGMGEVHDILAQTPRQIDGHHVIATRDGQFRLCSDPPCTRLRLLYGAELSARKDLDASLTGLEQRLKVAEAANNKVECEIINAEAGALRFQLETEKSGPGFSSEVNQAADNAAKTKPIQSDVLARYRNMSETELFRLAGEEADETAWAVIRERYPSNEAALRKILGKEYRPPHTATAIHRRGGKILTRMELQSGGVANLPAEERALGLWQRNAATHTERWGLRNASLQPGDVLEFIGQYDPCSTCRRAMQEAADRTGAIIKYWWPGGSPGLTFKPLTP